MNLRKLRYFDLVNTLRSKRAHLLQHARRFVYQALHIHAHAIRRIRSQIIDPASQHFDHAAVVASRDMVESYPDLQNTFVEIANRLILLGAPNRFERFVLV